MRLTAVPFATGLLIGSALGLGWPTLPGAAAWFVLVAALVSLTAPGRRDVRNAGAGRALAVVAASAAVGAMLASRAWHDTWQSSLRAIVADMATADVARAGRATSTADIARAGRATSTADIAAAIAEARVATVLVGTLRDDAAVSESGAVSLRVAVQWIGRARSSAADPATNPVRGDVLVSVAGDTALARMGEWRRGRTVRMAARLRRASRYLDPGVPDAERALARRGVGLVGSVKSGALVDVERRGSWWQEAGASLRAVTRRAIGESVGRWSGRGAAIVTAIVIGDRTGLAADVERRLQEAGTYHVIAISGGNVAVLAGVALLAFRLAGFLGRTAMISAAIALLGYGGIVSGGASVDRATCMAVVYFAGRALDLRGPPINALAVAAGLIVAVDPLAVVDPGFLLTFGASGGILLSAHAPAGSGGRRWFGPVVAIGLASMAAEAVLFPVSALVFSRVTLAGLVLNFVAIPAMAITQLAGMLAVPLWAMSPAMAAASGRVAALGADTLVWSAVLVEWVPQLAWRPPPPGLPAVVGYYGSLLVWWCSRRGGAGRRASRVGAAGAVVCAIWILWAPWTWWIARGDGHLHVTFIDVGQGDAALLQFPGGQTMLIDAGGAPGASGFDVGDRVVGPVLRSLGVRRLDTLLVTHGDADHAAGARAVIRDFRPREVWEGIPVPPSPLLTAIRADARRTGARWTRVQAGDAWFIDDVAVVAHHPSPPDWERQTVRNDDSVVIEVRWREVSLVFTGDIGREVEAALAPALAPARLRLVKVAHHGSQTSSGAAWVATVRPDVAVVSVGRGNTFGHPAAAVLARYEAAGAGIFRTDRQGAVSVDTDGYALTLTTASGAKRRWPAPASRESGRVPLHLLPRGLELVEAQVGDALATVRDRRLH